MTRKGPLTRGEMRLLIIAILFVAIVGSIGYGFYSINVDPVVHVPMPVMPNPNALDVYLAAEALEVPSIPTPAGSRRELTVDDVRDCIHAGKIAPRSRWGAGAKAPALADMQALMAKNTPAMSAAKKGFAFEYRGTPMRSLDQLFPDYSRLRNLARVMAADGEVKCASGNWDGGMERLVDVLRLGIDPPRGGGLLAAQLGIGIHTIGRGEAWTALDRVSGAAAKRAARRLEAMAVKRVPYADILQEEKWGMQASLIKEFNMPGWRSNGVLSLIGNASRNKRFFSFRLQIASKRAIIANYNLYMDAAIANAKKPYPAFTKSPSLPGDPICRLLVSIYDKAWLQYAINQTQNELLMVSLALRAYKADHGRYPADLNALVPAYLKAVPSDPFTAKGTLSYKVTGQSYVLYSVGPDGQDNGGAASADGKAGPTGRNLHVGSKGDIVAGVNTSVPVMMFPSSI